MTYDRHDEALTILQWAGPELESGAPNHAPMVVEALAALGHGRVASKWIERHLAELVEEPAAQTVLSGNCFASLGDVNCVGSWRILFREELSLSSWRVVLERWLPHLLPSAMATGTHGLIRCGHAVRALRQQETSARLEELAGALAYCAVRYRRIFGAPRLMGDLGLEQAVAGLPRLPDTIDRSGPPPSIAKLLNEVPEFSDAVARLTEPTDPLRALGALAELGAELYLQNASSHPLVLLHGVTGPAAVQLLVADQSFALRALAFAYAWQAVAAWISAFATYRFNATQASVDMPWDQIVKAAISSGDEHAIKFTEACYRMDAAQPSPAYRAAAADWVHRLWESCSWTSERLVDAGIRIRPTQPL